MKLRVHHYLRRTARILLYVGISISIAAFFVLRAHNQMMIGDAVDREIEAVSSAISDKVEKYNLSLDAMYAFYQSSNTITPQEFHRFVNLHTTERPTGLLGYSYAKIKKQKLSDKSNLSIQTAVVDTIYNSENTVAFVYGQKLARYVFSPNALGTSTYDAERKVLSSMLLVDDRESGEKKLNLMLSRKNKKAGVFDGVLLAKFDAKEMISKIADDLNLLGEFSITNKIYPNVTVYQTDGWNSLNHDESKVRTLDFASHNLKWTLSFKPCEHNSYLGFWVKLSPYIGVFLCLVLTGLAYLAYYLVARNERVLEIKAKALAQDQVLANERLKKSNSALERSLQEQKKLVVSLDRFAAVTAHDLSAPLKRAGAMIDIVLGNKSSTIGKQDKDVLKRARRSVGGLQEMVASLLTYSNSGFNPKKATPQCIAQITQNVVTMMAIPGLEKMISYDIEEEYCVIGDGNLLSHVVKNLISNGLKFNNSEEKKIHIQLKRYDDEFCDISFADNGIGISEDHRKKVFELFARLHNESQYPGHGIGLAFCDRIVSDHGGRIFVDAEYDNGTKMVVRLPIGKRPVEKDPKQERLLMLETA